MNPSSNTEKGCCHPRSTVPGLLPGWSKRLDRAAGRLVSEQASLELPRSPAHYSERTRFVDTAEALESLVCLAEQRPLSHIGFDTEFAYSRPAATVRGGTEVDDPRSIVPLLLSLSLAEPAEGGPGRLYNFVVDLRCPELLRPLERLLRLPVPFVGHFVKVELFCLWQLGLPGPAVTWDTWACEKALYLGRNHHQYRRRPGADEAEAAQAKTEALEDEKFSYSLIATCQRYGIGHRFAGDKTRLQTSFLAHGADEPFSGEQIEYAAEDAVVAARLYLRQVQAAACAGALHHLVTVEMPWTITNAQIEWDGVRVDPTKRAAVLRACQERGGELEEKARAFGIENCRSHKQLSCFFEQEGLLELFRRNGSYSFDKDELRKHTARHAAIPIVRAARRAHDLQSDALLNDGLVGADGRVHPQHKQLGAHTGRQTSRFPNVLGLDRVLRPLIVPEEGFGIGEIDWSQIEIGIAAAVYGDVKLIAMFNSGDVYSKMAMTFFDSELTTEERALTTSEFKRRYPERRNRMKACTLGIIYGMTDVGLGRYLGISKHEAGALQRRFLELFPDLGRSLGRSVEVAAIRGYAMTVTGLRRHRAGHGQLTSWERNWLTNHPVQGTGAVLLKAAGNRLRQLYRQYGAKIIVPFHDSIVFEAPLEVLNEVATLTERVMCDVVREYLPGLRPCVDVNLQDTTCWNKDGHSESVEAFVNDLTYHLDAV